MKVSPYIHSRKKRAVDLAIGSAGLAVFALLLPVCALIISTTSPGPVFYRRDRIGKDGKLFSMVKLRTMSVDSDRSVDELRTQGIHDLRVTKAGRIFRRTHLDEMPQFWSVIKGDMSVVGPRPEYVELLPRLVSLEKNFRRREVAKPGITGLAQTRYLHATGDEAAARRFRYDRVYIESGSLWLDIAIVFRTAMRVFRFRGM